MIKQTEFSVFFSVFEIMLPPSVKNGSVTTEHLVSLVSANDVVFVSTGCFLIAVLSCVSTRLKK